MIERPVVVVTGMAFEARIAAGPGVVTIFGAADVIAAGLAEAIARGCRGIASFGIAGGLVPHLGPGACVAARAVVTADGRIAAHPQWLKHLLQIVPGVIEADIAGVAAPVSTPHDKRELARATGAVAVDMESAIAAHAAARHGIPFAALRVVADPSDRALPPAARVPLRANGTPNLPAVLGSLTMQPGQLGALIRVGRDVARARTALKKARRHIGSGFGFGDVAHADHVPG